MSLDLLRSASQYVCIYIYIHIYMYVPFCSVYCRPISCSPMLRSIAWLQNKRQVSTERAGRSHAAGQREDSADFRIGRLKHERVMVTRGEHLLQWAMQVMNCHGPRKAVLEVCDTVAGCFVRAVVCMTYWHRSCVVLHSAFNFCTACRLPAVTCACAVIS